MTNPFLNALYAGLYIVGVVLLIEYITKTVGPYESILIPFAMLSLFVLSAAVMGYLFISGPAELYLAGKKTEAVRLFLSTVTFFAIVTAIFVFCAFYAGLKNQPKSLPADIEQQADL